MRKYTRHTRKGGGSFINSFRRAIGSNPNVARNPRTQIWSRKGSVKNSTYKLGCIHKDGQVSILNQSIFNTPRNTWKNLCPQGSRLISEPEPTNPENINTNSVTYTEPHNINDLYPGNTRTSILRNEYVIKTQHKNNRTIKNRKNVWERRHHVPFNSF
jgi:hypothetical protein